MFSPVAFVLCLYHWMVLSSPIPNTLNDTTLIDHHHQFSIEELLTTNFPKKISNDSGLNPCKAHFFLDDMAIHLDKIKKPHIARDTENDQEKHNVWSVSAKKILEKKKIWHLDAQSTHRIQKRAAATTVKERLWDHGIIPYEIDESWGSYRKALARQAMRHWENHTCLRFVERNQSEHTDYVFFTERPCGCCSFVGKRGIGAQALSIGENCAKFGIIVHEIGHAIGYYHEHTRPDRDKYVHVFEENIMEGQQSNFNKLSIDQVTSLGLKYDYNSIMHYARNTYSINGFLDTILPIGFPTGKQAPEIGQRIGLSEGDIEQTLILYNCPKCGKTFQSKVGTFSSPVLDLTTSSELVSCEWRITATPGEKVILDIQTMDVFQTTNCTIDYLEVRDGYSPYSRLLGRFCGSSSAISLKSESNRMLVLYSASHTTDHKGFTASFQVVCGGDLHIDSIGYLASPNYPDNYYPNKECIWKISVKKGLKVAIKFLTFDLEHHVDCSYDFVSIHNGLTVNSTVLQKFCGTLVPEPLIGNSSELTVRFFSDKTKQRGGFSAKVYAEFNECEAIDHGCEQLCINTLGSFQCGCNYGFELHSDKKTCVDACGGTFKTPNGTVTSPSFPELYPPKKRCAWIVEAPPQHVIFINFTHFDIEGNNYDNELCEYDHVNISSLLSNGKYKQHGSFCGTKIPEIISSESNLLKVTFGSDDSVQQSGFAAVYYTDLDECATRNGGCEHDCTNTLGSFQCSCRTGFTLHENQKNCIVGDCVHEIFTTLDTALLVGYISSPNYPKLYPASKDCAWLIKTSPGHRIRLVFMIFNLESHPECYHDSVQIYDGDSSKAHEAGRYCGAEVPQPIDSTENQLYMTFKSDVNVHKKGFLATYYTLCGGILQATTEKRQIYSHPSYGNSSYPAMRSCDWFLIGGDGYNVKLTFKEFELELEEECGYDFIEVFDGLHNNYPSSLGKFCGNKTGTELTSTEEGLVIKFRTDDRITDRGFILEYQLVETPESVEEYDDPLE